MSWFKKKKRQDDQKVLPNDVKAEDSLFGTRFYKQRGVQERAEIMLDANIHARNKIFRWTRVLIIGSIACSFIMYTYLFFRADSNFFASSGNGQVIQLETTTEAVKGQEIPMLPIPNQTADDKPEGVED